MGTTQTGPVDAARPRDALVRRILVTLGVIGAYMLMEHVPAPGLDRTTFGELGWTNMVSVVALGVSNLETGALLVEIAGWVVARRDLERRARLRARWVRPTALGLAALQGVGVLVWISSLAPTLERSPFVPMVGAPFLVATTFVAGVALLMLGVEAITRWGIGNGFTVWVLFENASSITEFVRADGLHHRTMLQWLGPYVPVEVMVPVAEEDAARAVLAGLGAYR